MSGYVNYNELYHYGVKGMKWGVRRYQNEDGTLTEAGKQRAKVDAVKSAARGVATAAISSGTPIGAGLGLTTLALGNIVTMNDFNTAKNLWNGNLTKSVTKSKAETWAKQNSTAKAVNIGVVVVGSLGLAAVGASKLISEANSHFLYQVEGDLFPKVGKIG